MRNFSNPNSNVSFSFFILQLELKLLVHHMGGSVRKEMHCKVTHLIAKLCSGEKYFYAMTFRVPVVSETWVHDAWKNRDVIGFNAAENDFVSWLCFFFLFFFFIIVHKCVTIISIIIIIIVRSYIRVEVRSRSTIFQVLFIQRNASIQHWWMWCAYVTCHLHLYQSTFFAHIMTFVLSQIEC